MYLAIDLGGTKTLVALLDEQGEVKKALKFPSDPNYQNFLIELQKTVLSLTEGEQISYCCMAIPGTIDRDNGIVTRFANLEWPRETPIKADLSAFIQCPIIIENDSKLAALSEARLVSDSYRKVLYVTISTGIGSGFVVDGRLEENLVDSEIGHSMYEHEGKMQEWEDFASGSWIVKTYGKKASELEDQNAWRQISKNIAIGLINSINTYEPDAIIIGGGVGTHLDKFKDSLDQALAEIDPKYNVVPPILKAQRPEEAVIYGCYELIKQKT